MSLVEVKVKNNVEDNELLVVNYRQVGTETCRDELYKDRDDLMFDQSISLEGSLEPNLSDSVIKHNVISSNEGREELTDKSVVVGFQQENIHPIIIETEKAGMSSFTSPLCGLSEEDERDIEIARADELLYQGYYQRSFPIYKKYAAEWQEDLEMIKDWLIYQQERGIFINKIEKDRLSANLSSKVEEICNFYAEQIMNNKENLEQAQIAWANGLYIEAINIYMALCNSSNEGLVAKFTNFKRIIPEKNNVPELYEPDNIYKVLIQLENTFVLSSSFGLHENTSYYEQPNEFIAGDLIEYITVS